MDVDRIGRAWAAGFFDGEGWAAAQGRACRAQINQASDTGVPEVLLRFLGAVGVGRIGGPALAEGREPLYHWVASSRDDVLAVFEALAPWIAAVKRKAFEDALGVVGPASEWDGAAVEEKLAWAAGLFDGEGWTGLFEYSSREEYYSLEMGITQSGTDGIPEALRRIAEVTARGRFYGPFDQGKGRKPVYRWKTFGPNNVGSVLHLLLPQLGVVKREQAISAVAAVLEQPPLVRGNPAWGAYKMYCINGHEYATARLRPYRPRKPEGRERRASKQCLICSREQARARRAARRSSPG